MRRRQQLSRRPPGWSWVSGPAQCVLLAAVQLGSDLDVGELDPLQVDRLALDAGVRTVNEHAVVVNHINNGAELARLLTVGDQADTAELHIALERHGACAQERRRSSGT